MEPSRPIVEVRALFNTPGSAVVLDLDHRESVLFPKLN